MKLKNTYWLATITVIVVTVLLVKCPNCLATYLTLDYSIDALIIQRKIHDLKDKVVNLEHKINDLSYKVDSLRSSRY